MAEKKKTKIIKKAAAKRKKPVKRLKDEVKPVVVASPAPPPAPAVAEEKVEAPSVPKEEVIFRPKRERLPKGPKYYGTGRRKEATVKVWLIPGSGKMLINGKDFTEYFCGRKLLEYMIFRPLNVTSTLGKYDVHAEAFGGGVPGQAGALSMGIARALLCVSPDFRVKLKREGLLRRDPRMKERKKYGRKRARKSFQFTKR